MILMGAEYVIAYIHAYIMIMTQPPSNVSFISTYDSEVN